MDKLEKLEHFFEKEGKFKAALSHLREIINKTELDETWKWSFPTYTLDGKNVVGLGSFKYHFGIWFFNGVFLEDKAGLLVNAQEGKTQAMRQLRFEDASEVDEKVVKSYVLEAIENQKQGRELKPVRKQKKPIEVPEELRAAFAKSEFLKNAFDQLTPGKQREYIEHIGEAKQAETRQRRLEKCRPLILNGVGLNDKYK